MVVHHFSKLERFSFFRKKPDTFKEAFVNVFGEEIRDETDIFRLTGEFCDIKWKKLCNGRIIRAKEIHDLRGNNKTALKTSYEKHHWPPVSVGGMETVKIPKDFHKGWHIIFLNLYRKEDIYVFLDRMFLLDELDSIGALYEAIYNLKKEMMIRAD